MDKSVRVMSVCMRLTWYYCAIRFWSVFGTTIRLSLQSKVRLFPPPRKGFNVRRVFRTDGFHKIPCCQNGCFAWVLCLFCSLLIINNFSGKTELTFCLMFLIVSAVNRCNRVLWWKDCSFSGKRSSCNIVSMTMLFSPLI